MSHSCHHQHHVDQDDPAVRLAQAKAHCESRGVRFTPLREEVLSLILSADHHLGRLNMTLFSALQQSRHATDSQKSKNIAPTDHLSLARVFVK